MRPGRPVQLAGVDGARHGCLARAEILLLEHALALVGPKILDVALQLGVELLGSEGTGVPGRPHLGKPVRVVPGPLEHCLGVIVATWRGDEEGPAAVLDEDRPQARRPVASAAIRVVAERAIRNSSKTQDTVLDPFARSTRAIGSSRMQVVAGRFVEVPDVALVTCSAPEVVGASGPAVEDRLVLALLVGAAEREGVLGPDDRGRPVAAFCLEGVFSVPSSADDMQM
jgi:hypothetical protein